jgi:formylglycine-generating enzyme required for sulfatase activity
MARGLAALVLVLLLGAASFAAEVNHVRPSQVGNRLVFDYDLSGDEPEVEVEVTLSVEGAAYSAKDLHLEGDFGTVKPGKAKRIYWNVLRDFPRGYRGDVAWKIEAGPREFKDPLTGMEFVFARGGCFPMGDTFGDGDADEKPVHEVCVSDFFMGKYEVTQGQWKAIMGNNPSHFGSCGDSCPVEQVSWNDVQTFIQKLNRKTGRTFRLPTEAEWEYAARSGGKKEKYAGTDDSLDDYAWYAGDSGHRTHPVGQKKANSLGVFDMSGSVREWVADRYDRAYYSRGPRDNPPGPSSGSSRILRGGGWNSKRHYVRAAFRFGPYPINRFDDSGFRIALSGR